MSNKAGIAADLVRLIGSHVGTTGPVAVESPWETLVELAVRNRLAPLLHRLAKQRSDVPDVARARLRDAATQWFMVADNQARALPELAEALQGCPWVLLRGPVLGALLYGDVALRPFIDLDVLVDRDDVPRAAAALRRRGFSDREKALSDGYYLRHHLHLHLVQSRGPAQVNLELHWAVDHPFRLVVEDVPGIIARAEPISVEGIQVAAPALVDLVLTLAQHTVKHIIDLPHRVVAGSVVKVVERGELLHLLDLALLFARHGAALDGDTVRRRAMEWGVAQTLRTCLDAVDGLWPGLPYIDLRASLPAPRLGRLDKLVSWSLEALPERAFRTRRRLFFRPARLVDAVRYIVPTGEAMRCRYGQAKFHRRLAHAVLALTHLIAGGVEFVYSTLVARLRAALSPGPAGVPRTGG